jgi:hypothetical protein
LRRNVDGIATRKPRISRSAGAGPNLVRIKLAVAESREQEIF